MARLSNDTAELVPRTSFHGPGLTFDFPGVEIGVAEYDEGPTGCTVFLFTGGPVACSIDVRGGSPAVSGAGIELVDAICLAGGSLYGLEAAAGVAAELLARREYSTDWLQIPLVAGAIIFDWGPRDNAVYPDKELGRAAVRAAAGIFPLGPRGAGRSATAGKLFAYEESEPAGQGGAFRQAAGTRVAVFTVVNAIGAIVDRDGNVVRGHYDSDTGLRRALVPTVEERLAAGRPVRPPPGNTTLTVVVTDLALDPRQLRTLGRQVHASMARAIQPFHALEDGDVLFAVSTGAVESDPLLDTTALGVIASEVAWDAVLSVAQ
jgi:L-aminopeptidase/D-esterase-like protein